MSNETHFTPAGNIDYTHGRGAPAQPVSYVLDICNDESVEVRNLAIAPTIMLRTWAGDKLSANITADLRLSPTEARKLAKALNLAALHCEHAARAAEQA